MRRIALLAALTLLPAIPARAQEDAAPRCDRTAIRWFLPGEFAAAQAQAAKEKRLLLIKGISFGVDEAGAKCATKGKW